MLAEITEEAWVVDEWEDTSIGGTAVDMVVIHIAKTVGEGFVVRSWLVLVVVVWVVPRVGSTLPEVVVDDTSMPWTLILVPVVIESVEAALGLDLNEW